MSLIVPFIIMSFATMRVARLIVKDDIFKEPRQKFLYWLAHGKVTFDEHGAVEHKDRHLAKWRDKLVTLASCPYCMTVHVAGVMTIIWHFIVYPLPAPVFVWLATCAGSLVVWEFIDGE